MNNIIKKAWLLLFIFTSLGGVFANSLYKTITPIELKQIQDSKKRVVIIDSLTPIHYSIEHIPGCYNIPAGNILVAGGKLNPRLPKNKAEMIVFYCLDIECPLSALNATEAIKEGYTNVYVMAEGIVGWKSAGYSTVKSGLVLPNIKPKTISASELYKDLSNSYLVALNTDVFNDGMIEGSHSVSFMEFMSKYIEIPKDKDVILYSILGKTDAIAIKFLVAKGYDENKIKYLIGGITEWIKQGYPVVK